MKRLILTAALILAQIGVASAAHERTVNQLITKLGRSVPKLQQAMQQRRGVENALSRVFVQASEGFRRVRLDAGKPAEAIGMLADAAAPQDNNLATLEQSLRMINDSLASLETARANGRLADIEYYMYQIAVAADVAAYQSLQGGWVSNPNDVAGIGAAFERDGDLVYMAGVIDSRIIRRVHSLNNVNTVVIVAVPGSNDDASNLTAIRELRNRRIDTHLMRGGSVESGGTDFLLGGVKRTVANDTFVGVHSWEGNGISGFALRHNRNDGNHQQYLSFYRDLNIPQEFYFFTLNTRAEDMDYMTRQEMLQYEVVTVGGRSTDEGGPRETGGIDSRLTGMWREFTAGQQTGAIGIRPNGAFLVKNDNGDFKGQASTLGSTLRLVTQNGDVVELQFTLRGDTLHFEGRDFTWEKSQSTEPNGQFVLSGRWVEIRTDGRPDKQVSIVGNKFTETVQGGRQATGRVSLHGNTLSLQIDGETEEFTVESNGDRLLFFDPNTGQQVQRFHWQRA